MSKTQKTSVSCLTSAHSQGKAMSWHSFLYFSLLVKLAFLILLATNSQALAQIYKIDPDHSRVGFRVRHMGFSWVNGQFDNFEGSIQINNSNFKASKVEARIVANSIDTQQSKRDRHLKSPDFLNAHIFKKIHFISQRIEGEDPNNFKLVGILTIRDQQREATLDVKNMGKVVDPWGIPRVSFEAKTIISRSDFGLVWNRLLETGEMLVDDKIEVTLDIQGVLTKDSAPKLIDPNKPSTKKIEEKL